MALLVRQVIADRQLAEEVDMRACQRGLEILMADVPHFNPTTLEQLDTEIKLFMDWQKELVNKTMGGLRLTAKERVVLMGLLKDELDRRHLEIEQKLYDMGVVERGQTDA